MFRKHPQTYNLTQTPIHKREYILQPNGLFTIDPPNCYHTYEYNIRDLIHKKL